jgi:hypothetical protein
MHTRISVLSGFVGFIAGVCFIAACPDAPTDGPFGSGDGGITSASTSFSSSSSSSTGLGVTTAHAETAGTEDTCAAWEVQKLEVGEGSVVIPSGWFPFAASANYDGSRVMLRRCTM